MAKGKAVGIETRSELASTRVGGAEGVKTTVLTLDAISIAIAQLRTEKPNFDKLSLTVVTQEIAKKLKGFGIKGIKTSSDGTISDGKSAYEVDRAYNSGRYTATEKVK